MFVSNDFRGKSNFEDDGTRNYLVFLSVVLCFKNMANSDNMSAWKSKGLSDDQKDCLMNILAPLLSYI